MIVMHQLPFYIMGPFHLNPLFLSPSSPFFLHRQISLSLSLSLFCSSELPMAGKISTLILTVDLDCYICSKKIRKTISKLEGREQIQTVTFDEKNNTVIISGLFDPEKLKKKLLCKASKVIKEIKIKEDPPAPKAVKPAETEKPKEKPKPVEPEKPKEKPKPVEPEKPKEKPIPAEPEKPKEKPKPQPKEPEKEKPKEPEKEKPKPQPKEPEKVEPKPQPKPEPVLEAQPVWPVGPPLSSCCWRPSYEQYYGGCRCRSCGMFFGWSAPPFPPAGGCMYGPSGSTCQFFCEEDPASCTIM